ncbi:hypothetical protein Taro_047600, partial [Colocasia esculenta]|nr:hypothetical protein [Colocasia esculenta]
EQVLELAEIVWRSSWWLGSRRSSTPSHSSSPVSSAATCADHHLEVNQSSSNGSHYHLLCWTFCPNILR